jgi:hypothetical protein
MIRYMSSAYNGQNVFSYPIDDSAPIRQFVIKIQQLISDAINITWRTVILLFNLKTK